jgi:hypothetical protein
MGVGIGIGLGIGLAACPALVSQDAFLNHLPDAVNAARLAASSLSVPKVGNPFVAHAWEVKPALGSSSDTSQCPLGYGVTTDPTVYKVLLSVSPGSLQWPPQAHL